MKCKVNVYTVWYETLAVVLFMFMDLKEVLIDLWEKRLPWTCISDMQQLSERFCLVPTLNNQCYAILSLHLFFSRSVCGAV